MIDTGMAQPIEMIEMYFPCLGTWRSWANTAVDGGGRAIANPEGSLETARGEKSTAAESAGIRPSRFPIFLFPETLLEKIDG